MRIGRPMKGHSTSWSRRDLLAAGLSSGLVLGLAGAASALPRSIFSADGSGTDAKPSTAPAVPKAEKSLSILVLGGTIFLGPAIVERLLARGHSVTLFNRGKSNPMLFPNLEKIRGDRTKDLSALKAEIDKGRKWDAVLDTSAYIPRAMRESTTLLAPAVDHYVLVATVNVYSDDSTPDQDENGPTHTQWPDDAEISNEQYGPMKRGCEVELEKIMPGRSCSVRPSLIAGPRDVSDRFSYWPVRALRGGDMLAPVSPMEKTQVVDVRDLAAFMVHLAETKQTGAYNTLGHDGLTMGEVIEASINAAKAHGTTGDKQATVHWAPLDFLEANQVQPWAEIPAWVPDADGSPRGMMRRVGAKSRKAGFKSRPIEETCDGVLTWWKTLPEKRRESLRAGLKPDREADLLAKLKKG